MLAGSGVVASHRGPDCNRVQDAYSLRCSPQVHGAARDTVEHAATVAGRELASAVDNPVVLTDEGRVESNGNFHGAPVAYVLDFLAIVAADVASMSERRTDRFLDKARNHGLPPFLADDPGVDSGLMIAQYTQAAIVSELKRLAVPASVDSIPSSAMQEDHVSMGWGAARKLRRSVDGLTRVVAIEVLTAARALDLRRPLEPSPASEAVIAVLRAHGVEGPGPDRHLSPEIEAAVELVRSGAVLQAVEDRDRRTRMTTQPPTPAPRREPAAADPRRPRHRADRPVVADRGAAADADEQPRPGERRAPRGPRGLRRHRQGGAQLGGVRRAGAHADHAGRRRDDARAVGQAGRRDADPRVGAAGADRQLQPGRRLGQLGGVPPARGPRA